ncbi:MAG TPA: winged helix-turn-helix domain-containing protein [Terriglobales bacterium]|nr:winged helix-turn-helix domain-containing protein [Terriglobales bacterium]
MSQPVVYEFGSYRLDPTQQLLTHGGREIPLTPKAFQTLLVLVENQGRIVGKEELLKKVWPSTVVEEATVAQNVFTLRKQLQGEDNVQYIETLPKRGYRFVAKVRIAQPAHAGTTPAEPPPAMVETSPLTKRLPYYLGIAAAVCAGALLVWRPWSHPGVSPEVNRRIMLAVLPVQNLTGNPGQEYLADGLTDEVIADLGGLNPERLGVIARTSAMAYKQSNKNIQQIARELHVDYILEASVRQGSGQIRFTAQLIRTQDQTHVWAQNYQRSMADILAMQSDLARTVAEQIRVKLPQAVAARLASPRQVSPQAYDAYSRGRYFWNKRTTESMTLAERYFLQAIQADPNFAPSYAGLADCYQVMVNLNQIPPEDGFARAKAAAEKALELDGSLAEAYTSLASIKGDHEWDWQSAESGYKRAIELDPNYATAHHWYGDFLAGMGRFEEGMAEIRKAEELDPLSPVIRVSSAGMSCWLGRCTEAIQELQRTLDTFPDFGEAHEALAEIYGYLGQYQESVAELEKEREPPLGHVLVLRGFAAAKGGHTQEAWQIVRQIEGQTAEPHTNYWAAMIYAGLGDKDRAFARLETARQTRDPYMPYVRSDLALKDLGSDPRLAELFRRMKMPG